MIFTIFAVNFNCGAFSHNGAFYLQCFFITELFFHSALYSELFIAELFQNRAYYASAFIGGAFLQHDPLIFFRSLLQGCQLAIFLSDEIISRFKDGCVRETDKVFEKKNRFNQDIWESWNGRKFNAYARRRRLLQ